MKKTKKKKGVFCTCCGNEINTEDYGYDDYAWSGQEEDGKMTIFCSMECIARWYGDEITDVDQLKEYAEIEED